ncbi:MAG: hypothetical protein AAB778_00090 [Patescibacteria group bacterium]
MELNIVIRKFELEITPVIRKDNIKGFVIWTFVTDRGELKIKGGTIRLKEFGSKRILTYDFPAYRAGFKFCKAVFMSDLELYKTLCNATVEQYCQMTGDLRSEIFEAEINLDDIK